MNFHQQHCNIVILYSVLIRLLRSGFRAVTFNIVGTDNDQISMELAQIK